MIILENIINYGVVRLLQCYPALHALRFTRSSASHVPRGARVNGSRLYILNRASLTLVQSAVMNSAVNSSLLWRSCFVLSIISLKRDSHCCRERAAMSENNFIVINESMIEVMKKTE